MRWRGRDGGAPRYAKVRQTKVGESVPARNMWHPPQIHEVRSLSSSSKATATRQMVAPCCEPGRTRLLSLIGLCSLNSLPRVEQPHASRPGNGRSALCSSCQAAASSMPAIPPRATMRSRASAARSRAISSQLWVIASFSGWIRLRRSSIMRSTAAAR